MSVHSKKSSSKPARPSQSGAYTGTPPETWDLEQNDITWGPAFKSDPARAEAYRQQMVKWLQDPYTLDERWKARAKRELNESSDPAKLHQEVEELRKLVLAEKGIRSRVDDHFLLSFLRSKRHEIKPALTSLLKYYRMRKVNNQYFELFLPSEHPHAYQMGALNILEGYDLLGRVICYFTANFDPQYLSTYELIKMLIHFLDTVILDPRVQVAGLTILVNLKQQSMAHTKIVTVHFLKLMLQIFQGSFPVRMKLVLLCHGSFLFRATFAIIRPFIPEKFKERIHIMGNDTKKLLNFIPLNMIPVELGGELANIRLDTMMERIALNEDRLREWNVYGFSDDVNLNVDRMPSLQFDPDPGPDPEKIRVHDEELRRRIEEEEQRGSDVPVTDSAKPGSSGAKKSAAALSTATPGRSVASRSTTAAPSDEVPGMASAASRSTTTAPPGGAPRITSASTTGDPGGSTAPTPAGGVSGIDAVTSKSTNVPAPGSTTTGPPTTGAPIPGAPTPHGSTTGAPVPGAPTTRTSTTDAPATGAPIPGSLHADTPTTNVPIPSTLFLRACASGIPPPDAPIPIAHPPGSLTSAAGAPFPFAPNITTGAPGSGAPLTGTPAAGALGSAIPNPNITASTGGISSGAPAGGGGAGASAPRDTGPATNAPFGSSNHPDPKQQQSTPK